MDSLGTRLEEVKKEAFELTANTTDANKILSIWYDGPYKYAKVTIAATTITGKADDTDGATTAAGWGTAGVITFTTFGSNPATLEEIANEINKMSGSGWHCDIIGALKATATASGVFMTQAAITCTKSAGGYYVLGDTSAILLAGLRIGYLSPSMTERGAIHTLGRVSWDSAHSAGTAVGKIYEVNNQDGGVPSTETLLYTSGTITTGTTLTKDISDFGVDVFPIRTKPGGAFLITLTGGTTVTGGYITAAFSSFGGSPRPHYRSNR